MIVTALPGSKDSTLQDFYLGQNYPNPFKKKTNIRFYLPCKTRITIIVTNCYGKILEKFISRDQEAGNYEFEFFADGLSKGIYFYHLVADNYFETREMEIIL